MSTAQSGNIFTSFHKYPVIIGNVRIPLFFRFMQNPNKLSFTFKKDYQQTKTIGGYVFEHWGRQPIIMKGEVIIKKSSSLTNFLGLNTEKANFGVEDSMYSPELMTLQTLFNIDQRRIKAWNKQLENVKKGITYTAGLAATLKNPITTVQSGVAMATKLMSNNKNVKFKDPDPASLDGYIGTLTDTIILYKGVIYSGFFTDLSYEEDGREPFFNKVHFTFTVTYTTNDWIDTTLTQTAAGRAIAGLFGATTSTVTIGSMIEDIFTDSGHDTNGHI